MTDEGSGLQVQRFSQCHGFAGKLCLEDGTPVRCDLQRAHDQRICLCASLRESVRKYEDEGGRHQL